jgi:hypothetical protein
MAKEEKKSDGSRKHERAKEGKRKYRVKNANCRRPKGNRRGTPA